MTTSQYINYPVTTLATPPSPVSGSLATSGNTVVLPISGAFWATARFQFFGTFASQTLEFDYTIDGVNWLPSGQGAPYVRRIDTASANPTIIFGSTATVGGNSLSFNINTYGASTWELPLAANVQAVRVKSLSTAGGVTVGISAGLPYNSWNSVTATFFDVTSTSNTALDTGTLDVSGWRNTLYILQDALGAGPVNVNLYWVDDTGSPFQALTSNGALSSQAVGALGVGAANTGGATGVTNGSGIVQPKRIRATIGAASATSGRIRLEVQR